jgi:hypothetical protein
MGRSGQHVADEWHPAGTVPAIAWPQDMDGKSVVAKLDDGVL